MDYTALPRVTFTSPATAAAGLTEAELIRSGVACDCRVLPLSAVPRAIVNRDTRGLIVPTEGTIRLNGYDVGRRRADAVRQIGAILEASRNVYWPLTAWQNLMHFGRLKGLLGGAGRRRRAGRRRDHRDADPDGCRLRHRQRVRDAALSLDRRRPGPPVAFLILTGTGYSLIMAGMTLPWKRIQILMDVFLMLVMIFAVTALPVISVPGWFTGLGRVFPVTADVASLYGVMLGHRGVTGLWGTGGLVWVAVIAAGYLTAGLIVFRVLEHITRIRGTLGAY